MSQLFDTGDDTDPLVDDELENPPNMPVNPPNVPVIPPVPLNPPGSQSRPSQKKRELTLKHGVTMRVTACGPIDQSGDIKLKMDWSVPTRNIVDREIVIPWDDTSAKKAKDKIWKKLGGPVFLDSDDQARDFPRFLEQRIDVLEAQKNEDGNSSAKPIKEFQDVELYEIWEDKTLHVYLIAGKKEIFLLGEDEANWAHKLSDQEIESFPVEIYYTGPETNFEVNSKTTTELLFKIISSINVAQDEDYHSFPLFSICSSVTGYLYRVRMQKIKNFVTTMTISGEGFSTGKSLMYEAIMLALYGKRLQCATPTTIPRLYEMLAAGIPIYVREWSDDLWKILEEAAKACWEANGKTVNKVHRVPATAMFVSANLTVEDVEKRLKEAIRTKVVLLYTGDKRLKHPNLSELCEELLDAARELYKFLPSLVGLGVRSMMTKISTAQVQAYNGELRIEDDDREAQTLMDYDGFYTELLEKAREYMLDLPPLFQKNFIDHRSMTGYHQNKESSESNLRIFLEFLETSGLYDLLVPASSSYKGKGDPRLPPQIKIALMKTLS